MTALRVALFAHACRPLDASEPGIGWQWATLAARRHAVWVFTDAANRDSIEQAPALPGATFVYVESPGERAAVTPWLDAVSHLVWARRAVARARELHAEVRFDLSHHATNTGYWNPAPYWRLGLPHVSGPLSGGERTHPAFGVPRVSRQGLSDQLRELMLAMSVRHPDWRRTAARDRTLTVCTTAVTQARVERAGAAHVELYRPTFFLDDELLARLGSIADATPKSPRPTFVVTGRQLRWKGVSWAVEAFAWILARLPDAQLHLIGDGAEHGRLVAQVEQLGLREAVRLHRRLPVEEERRLIAEAHALLFPSQRDAGATVMLLAGALGTPVVGFDVGAARAVIGEAGCLVEPSADGRQVRVLAEAALAVYADPARRADMAASGRQWVRAQYGYEQAAAALNRWYEWAAARAEGRR